jgi:hypothetical protein
MKALDTLPVEADKDDSMLAYVVAECADPDEWKALALAVRRATPDGRVEFLRLITRVKTPEGHKHRLAFLAEYLIDDELSKEHPHRYLPPELEVRNFVALRLAAILAFDVEPDRDWTAAQWSELRAKVQAKVKDELQR